MFQRWGFLLGEIWVLLLLAALLGLFAGWLIWGRRATAPSISFETDNLRGALAACDAKSRDQATRIATLEANLKSAKVQAAAAHTTADNTLSAAGAADEAAPTEKTAGAPTTATPLIAAEPAQPPHAVAAIATDNTATTQPKGLTEARGGTADDLKLIKGIGPKLEILCNRLGFFHFDQIADWTAKEIAWVDENLEGFKGRVTRDEWVVQARDLMNGLPPRPGSES